MVDNDAVTLAYVHDGESVAYSWYFSVLNLLMHDSGGSRRLARGGYAQSKFGAGGLPAARNNIVADWLANTSTGWLAWVDTDMGFAPETVDRLFEVADPAERPVVGALTFAHATGDGDGWGGYRPVMWPVLMSWVDDGPDRGFYPVLDYPRDSLVQAAATGSACILIHRSVFDRLRELNGGGTWSRWYHPLPTPNGVEGAELSEDFSFCLRLREAGIPLFVHTGVKTTHLKPLWLCEEGYLASRAQQAVSDVAAVAA